MLLLGTECFANLSGGEFMARSSQPDLFVTESQSELFRCGGNSSYRPDTGKVRAAARNSCRGAGGANNGYYTVENNIVEQHLAA